MAVTIAASLSGCGAVGPPATRADSLAALHAVLAPHFRDEGVLYFDTDADPLVLSAARSIDPDRVVVASSAAPFCSAEDAPPETEVGSAISVSLEPGEGPLGRAPASRGWQPAFYVDGRIAYVEVSSRCLSPSGRGGAHEFPDGRVARWIRTGATLEVRRESSGWQIARSVRSWIT